LPPQPVITPAATNKLAKIHNDFFITNTPFIFYSLLPISLVLLSDNNLLFSAPSPFGHKKNSPMAVTGINIISNFCSFAYSINTYSFAHDEKSTSSSDVLLP